MSEKKKRVIEATIPMNLAFGSFGEALGNTADKRVEGAMNILGRLYGMEGLERLSQETVQILHGKTAEMLQIAVWVALIQGSTRDPKHVNNRVQLQLLTLAGEVELLVRSVANGVKLRLSGKPVVLSMTIADDGAFVPVAPMMLLTPAQARVRSKEAPSNVYVSDMLKSDAKDQVVH